LKRLGWLTVVPLVSSLASASLLALGGCSSDDKGASATGGHPGSGGHQEAGGAGGGTGSGGRGTGGATGTGGLRDAGGDTTTACSSNVYGDDFSGTQLDPCWTVLNGDSSTPLITWSISNGSLHLTAQPTPDGVWYQGSTRSLIYKTVTAMRFKVTTTVHPRKRTDLTAVPTHELHVGGLMARDPASHGGNTENYLFVMAGHPEGNDGVVHMGTEVKSTTNGTSVWDEPDWPANDADLRICRIDSDFYLYKRVPGTTTWMLSNQTRQAASVSRPDMPATLQVGMGLNFSSGSDLDVAFDQIVMSPNAPATQSDCTTD